MGFPVYTSPNISKVLEQGQQQVGESDWLALYTMSYQIDSPQPDRVALVDKTEYLSINSFGGKLGEDPTFEYDPAKDLLVRVPHSQEGLREQDVTVGIANALAQERASRAWRLYRRIGLGSVAAGWTIIVGDLATPPITPVALGVGVGITFGGAMLRAFGNDRRRRAYAPEGYASGMAPVPIIPA